MKLLRLLLLLFSVNQLSAQELDLYFPNNETEMMQYERPRQFLVGLASSARAVGNLQLGYSPINHLSLDVGYMFQINNSATGSSSQEVERTKRAFTFALGTYWILKKGDPKKGGRSARIDPHRSYSKIILTAKAGYSFNDMESTFEKTDPVLTGGTPEDVAADINYQSAFAMGSFGYGFEFGLLNITASYRRLYYQRVSFSGRSFDDLQRLTDITTELREDAIHDVFSVGAHCQFGTGPIRVLTGGNFPVVYFQDFKNQSGQIDGRYMYLGVLFDIEKVWKMFAL